MAVQNLAPPAVPSQQSERLTRVALYARVSTLNGQDPEMQLAELREYAGRRGFQIVEEFIEAGVSGAKESRPQLNRLMVDAQRRRFDAVLVWKLDRFGRSLKHLVNSLAELEAMGVAFVSLRDNLDLATPSGRLMFQIIGAMAEFERALIQERVRAGIKFVRTMHGQRPRFHVEAKRLYRSDSVNEYFGADGLQMFVNGTYAREWPSAGMIGYVQSDDCTTWELRLADGFSRRISDLAVCPEKPSWAPAGWASAGLYSVQRSCHLRAPSSAQIEIFHLLLNFVA